MRKEHLTQTKSVTWAASSSPQIDLDNPGLTTEYGITAEIVPSATLTGANQPDGLLRAGRNLKIEGGGNTFFTLPDHVGGHGSTLLYYLNRVDYNRAGHPSGAIVAPQRTYTPMTWWLHAGGVPSDPYDLSGFVPGLNTTNPQLTWVTTPNSVMDDTVTLSSAVLRINQRVVIGKESEVLQEMHDQGVVLPQTSYDGRPLGGGRVTGMMPSWIGNTELPVATATEYSSVRNIPVGAYLRRVTVLSQDATATRPVLASDVATGMRIKLFNQTIVEVFGDELMNSLPYGSNLTANSGGSEAAGTEKFGADFNNSAPRGIMPYPLFKAHNKLYGTNLIGVPAGSAELGLTITTNAAGDAILILYERMLPYFGKVGFGG